MHHVKEQAESFFFEWSHYRISSTDSKVRVTYKTPSSTLAVKGSIIYYG